MQEIKLWEIDNNSVQQITKSRLDYENRLEKWLLEDISILSHNLVVIGSQVVTPYGKVIDILAINSVGDVIIVELKRDKTYREVVAQVLDYATWVKDLDYDELNTILNKYGKTEYNDIEDLFSSTFNKDVDDVEFNSDHKMLIVGSEIDDSTVRIINYLSNEPYSININAVNFNYFKNGNDKEFLGQSFVLPEQNITAESKSKKRKRAKSIIAQLFDQNKLFVGQNLFYQPAIESGVDKSDYRVKAKIVNTGTNCLERENDENTYSFSGLRRKIVDEFELTDIRKFWGFGIRYEWITDDGIKLVDLLDG
ncbi:MAG: hypothetical protein V3U92_18240 [Cellulophaga sp.]